MKNLEDIIKSGVTVDMNTLPTGFCLLSLKTALKSYFETLDSLGRGFGNPIRADLTDKVDVSNKTEFYVKSAETILHFHHFFELLIKDILRQKHSLLSNIASDNDVIFYKLLFNESLPEGIEENLKTIEFDKTIKRFYKLLDEGVLDTKYDFLNSHKDTFNKLNILRNRLWHRGLYLLDYEGVDFFVGRYILPIVQELAANTDFLKNEEIWKYQKPKCGIDPIDEIVSVIKDDYQITVVGFIKEIGRASYENPLKYGHVHGLVDNQYFAIASSSAEFQSKHYKEQSIRECPVCGKHTLLIENHENGGPEFLVEIEARCTLCTFTVSNRIQVPSKFNDKIKIWK